MRDVSDLKPDPDNPGWFLGFVVVNPETNVAYDIYPGQIEAFQEAKRLGGGFKSLGGRYCPELHEYWYSQSILLR
ncbi:hypothetical protein ACIOVF_19025 [Pseudomonas sp. NPDC087612]|uniref:hypothetical protein n=1 Tax=Pseudomonas sp. NPDC087612 TaxID=3364441 RepID=UPI0038102E21